MKLAVWVEKEIEVDVSISTVMEEIERMPSPESQHQLLALISTCFASVAKASDEQLAMLTDRQREIVVKALRDQLARFEKIPQAASA